MTYFITTSFDDIGFAIIPEKLQLHSVQAATIFKNIPESNILHRLNGKAHGIRICCHNCSNNTSVPILWNNTL